MAASRAGRWVNRTLFGPRKHGLLAGPRHSGARTGGAQTRAARWRHIEPRAVAPTAAATTRRRACRRSHRAVGGFSGYPARPDARARHGTRAQGTSGSAPRARAAPQRPHSWLSRAAGVQRPIDSIDRGPGQIQVCLQLGFLIRFGNQFRDSYSTVKMPLARERPKKTQIRLLLQSLPTMGAPGQK